MPVNWTLRDVTELDLLLQRDVRLAEPVLKQIRQPERGLSGTLHAWLIQCRNQEPEAGRLAEITIRSEGVLRLALCLLGLLMGLTLAAGLLQYEGSRLINIGFFLGVVVGGQLLLLFAMGLGHLISRKPVAVLDRWLLPKPLQRLSSSLSLPMWGWRLFTTLQLSALFANLGILLGLFWNVLTRDLAFGWATTLNTGPESIHRLVSILSAPWGGQYTPTLEQIEHSRIRISQGISDLPADATASWWPFLLLCILVYGILPRLILAAAGQWRFNMQLKRPRFDSAASQRLYQRLTRNPLQFDTGADSGSEAEHHRETPSLPAFTPSGSLNLRVEHGVLSDPQQASLQHILEDRLSLHFTSSPDEASGVLQVEEAWMPPLEETRQRLRALRTELGSEADLLLLLLGKPSTGEGLPSPPDAEDVTIWQTQLSQLGDPHLGILIWPGEQP